METDTETGAAPLDSAAHCGVALDRRVSRVLRKLRNALEPADTGAAASGLQSIQTESACLLAPG